MSKNISYHVTKEGGTEKAFDNAYWDEHRPGIYVDINTGKALFSSLDKFDSGTGWPSFTKPIDDSAIKEKTDASFGMVRTEVRTDESHLGHVFDDGPNGMPRFCINSAALNFIPYEELEAKGYGKYKGLFPYKEAIFAGGCFWGVETLFQQQEGVVAAVSGYAGGKTKNPTYKVVSTGLTGHAESVLVVYDPSVINYTALLNLFWRMHDPTQKNRQGPDVGSQYRSAIFYLDEEQKAEAEKSKREFDAKGVFGKPAVTEIVPATAFYPAEDYHQDYSDKNPGYACHALRPE
ncbi:MAG: bifunctional methionine sulfoxide reductase B/A protein [Nanoarchaeota archaeon]|nr:bifunctional methionine sulfoxide reductase B/A protein [Nanoarchaeota archaeon]